MSYLWIKSLHVLAVISWMAGMLYLPRLFVYHTGVPHGSDQSGLFEVMEYRLLRFIMTPAMVVTWLSGLYLVYAADFLLSPWFHAKFVLVVGMTGMHGYLASLRKDFIRGRNQHGAKFYRALNEVPTVLMIGIVVLVVVKPFA